MRRAAPLLASLPLLVLAAIFDLRRVADEEMAPSLRPGDWLLIGPGAPRPGEVVRVHDPADPDQERLRRVLAPGGARVSAEGAVLRVDGQATRTREMGRDERHVVLSEQDAWLIRRRLLPAPAPARGEAVPADALWLMADDRDGAVDSRWWGPLPAEAVTGRVWLRLGPSDAWRGALGVFGQDGPWIPPSRRGG